VRNMFESLRTGKPKYELMTAAMADVTRQQLTQLQSATSQLGAVQSVTFKSVGPGGMDIFDVKFEHGSMETRISLDAEGKVAGMNFRPM
jgi:phosphoribosylaminoimidazole-succinocarboxamide synthase